MNNLHNVKLSELFEAVKSASTEELLSYKKHASQSSGWFVSPFSVPVEDELHYRFMRDMVGADPASETWLSS